MSRTLNEPKRVFPLWTVWRSQSWTHVWLILAVFVGLICWTLPKMEVDQQEWDFFSCFPCERVDNLSCKMNDVSIIRHQNVWERRSVVTHRCGEQRLPRPAADAGYWRIRCSLKFTVSRPGQFTQTANYKTNWLMLTWCCFAHENTTNGPAGAFSVTDLNECRSGAAVYHTYYRNHMFKRIYLRTNSM